MGSMLRSDKMTFCEMYLQPEAAFEIMSHLGEMGCVQFLDSNTEVQAFQRNYVSEVCRCAEMERRLRYMEAEMAKDKIYVPELHAEPKALQPNEMSNMENILERWEDNVRDISEHQTSLRKNYLEMNEMLYVLTQIGPMLGDAEFKRDSIFSRIHGGGDLGLGGMLVILTGVVRRTRSFHFEMMLWRVSRGNIYYRQASQDKILQDPATGQDIRKVAFLAVCQGEQLNIRMHKVCSGFRVNVYPCPKSSDERLEMIDKLEMRIDDLRRVIKKTHYHRCKALRTIGKQWHGWFVQVRKAKAIYHYMNLFNLDITKKCLIGRCWIPDLDLRRVQETLHTCSINRGSTVHSFVSKTETTEVPPTFHRTNKFTAGFQVLVNAYGDSYYRELNPGLYTIITFPFLFALMFGDSGHGLLVVIFATWMIVSEKKYMGRKITNEIWKILFGGRYVILLLGLFSIYTGFIYNDWFSMPIAVKPTYWINNFNLVQLENQSSLMVDPGLETNFHYSFGIDPIWGLSHNKILVENSIKMKLSIIVGIIHMIFGVILSLFNHIFFKRYHAIYLEFLPQILFLCSLFLWLIAMMYYKWFIYTAKTRDVKLTPGCAPQILILFIDMILLTATKPVEDECDAYMFDGQRTIQTILLLVALACVPVLLFGSPCYIHLYNKWKRRQLYLKISKFRKYQQGNVDQITEELLKQIENYRSNFSEMMIHQGVHTIEFVLSTISHTASYLRLWALSLAHGQLSHMLWVMILSKLALRDHTIIGAPKLFVIFAIWEMFTVSILVVMEGLSAFLHTLRLHWVEFMSKFYNGGGHGFHPYSFKTLLTSEEDKYQTQNICENIKKRRHYY